MKTFSYLKSKNKHKVICGIIMAVSFLFISGCNDKKSTSDSSIIKPTTEPTTINQPNPNQSKYLYPIRVEEKGKVLWGYINDKGKVVIKPRWDGVESFKSYGIAKVYNYNRNTGSSNSGIVDYKGNEIIPIKNGSWEFPVIGPKYIVACSSDEIGISKSIVYDMEGKEIFITDKYINRYSDGYFVFNDNGLLGLMDNTGKVIKSGMKDFSEPAKINNNKDKLTIFERSDKSKYGLKDVKGNVIVEAKYDSITENDNGESFYCQNFMNPNDKPELLGKDGKIISIKNYSDIQYYGDGLYLICFDSDFHNPMRITYKYKIYDIRTGSMSDSIYMLGGKLNDRNDSKTIKLSVYDGNKSFLAGRDGKQLLGSKSFKGKWIFSYEGNLMKVASQSHFNNDEFFAYYDKYGKEIWKTTYEFDIGNMRTLKRSYYSPNIFYSASYFELRDAGNSSAETKFNSQIKKIIEYKKTIGRALIGIESKYLISKDLLTVIHTESSYGGGGMGNYNNYYYHFNLNTGEQFEPLSFLKKGDSYKRKLQKTIKKRFESKYKENGFYPQDAGLDKLSQNYYFTRDGIVFIIDGYKFHGDILVKFVEIDSLIDKNSKILSVCDLSKYSPYVEKKFLQ